LGSIKKLRTKYKINKLKKGDLVRCLLIQNKIQKKNANNILYTFFNNYAIILNEQNLPMGTRIFCSILAEPFRNKKLYRILTIAKKVI
jgi:large subunit ribosomal protein L14